MITCIVTSAEKTKRCGGLRSVILPAYWGRAQILPDHAESFIILKKGDVVLESPEKKEIVQIEGGECYVKDNAVLVIL